MIEEIDALEAARRLASDSPPVLLDVREAEELAIVAMEGAVHIPMGEIPSRSIELDPDRPIICMCHHGMRSAQVAAFLADRGFENLANMTGGIDAWAAVVDTDLPRY